MLGRLYRWWVGGHWERWTVNDGRNNMWFCLPWCTHGSGVRPTPDCLGTPTCEHYPQR